MQEQHTLYERIIYFLTNKVGHNRKNELTNKDIKLMHESIEKGDLILLTDYKDILYKTVFKTIGELFTHVAMYQGQNKIVHANSLGVHVNSLHYVAKMYDAFVILRPKQQGFAREAVKYAKSQIHLPYDFKFTGDTQHSFCTELVNEAYKCAGYHTKLSSIHHYHSSQKKAFSWVIGYTALRPDEMLQGNFEIVAYSHNLTKHGHKFNRKL